MFNGQELRRSLKCVPFTLLNHSFLSYIVLALSSAANNLSNKTLIFHDFQGPTPKFHDYTRLEMTFLNSMTFQVFHDLYEPCFKTVNKKNLSETVATGDEEYRHGTTSLTFCIHPLSSNAPALTSCALDLLQQTRADTTGCYGYGACHLAPFLVAAERTLDLKSASTTWKLYVKEQ